MKTGDCNYGSSCRYRHPPEVNAPKADFTLIPLGLPLRTGASPCTHFSQCRVCKFGPACRFDHPMEKLSYSPSGTSLSVMPVGSTIGTRDPSSSSSDLLHELSGSSKDPAPTIMSLPVSSSSESIGSVFSKGASVPNSSKQQSSSNSAPSTGCDSTEAHTSS